jgi:hypothetical protein
VSRVRAAASGAVVGGPGAAGTGAGSGPGVLLAFVIFGIPRTKKNHSRIVGRLTGRPRLLPSEANAEWERVAMGSMYGVRAAARKFGVQFPIQEAVNCRAVFYRHADVGDANGFYQALADFLQKAGVLKNDRQIKQWDGARLRKDSGNPRIEVWLEKIAPESA